MISFFLGPCGKPEDIPHTKVEGSSYKFKDILSYTCDKGYALDGPADRTCREDGIWSKAPTCYRKSYFGLPLKISPRSISIKELIKVSD